MTNTKSGNIGLKIETKYEPVMVTVGDRFCMMMRELRATSPDGRFSVRLALVPPGRYVVIGVEFNGDVEDPISARDLRIPLERIVTDATKLATVEVEQTARGTLKQKGHITLPEAQLLQRRSPKRTLTPEFLRSQVSPVIAECEANGVPVGRGLAEKFHISPSTARNWIEKVREIEGDK